LDGRAIRGSIEDYWVTVDSTADDPYITGSWTQHTWGTAIGDYMKTSQSAYNNVDGSTRFYYYPSGSKLPCSSMPDDAGTLGRKLFYEERGYVVDDLNCYSQPTDNNPGITDGFTLADYQAEIDAGHPVMLNLAGHTVVGFGYDESTLYIRDTWDSNPDHVYSMTWGGTYNGRDLLSVSVVRMFGKSNPYNGAVNQDLNLTLSWGSISDATGYEYCIYESGGSCTTWTSTGTSRTVELSGLSEDTTYEWQVRANNGEGTIYADGSESAFWSFTTQDPLLLTEKVFLPLLVRD
jgi:hypothetical protein